ncbi:galactosyltransferase-related protein [Neptunomonas sp.]|uniref:galactosyltransferase-related protein n=1 Tax=Neptunomonas sp. TaxID=1971898 RepID=UPI00356AD77D
MYFWNRINYARELYKSKSFGELYTVLSEIAKFISTDNEKNSDKYKTFFESFIKTYSIDFDISDNKNKEIHNIIEPSKLNNNVNIDLDKYVEKVGVGVSLVTCCMNRNENLVKALPSWLECAEINEIIIVDWSSTEPVKDYIRAQGLSDKRIKVIRVDDQPRWILSYAFNIGFRAASYNKILKTDADILVNDGFFTKNLLKSNMFISGDWRIADKGQEHINGFFFVSRENLIKIKGFNEYITTYGWDDDDIYSRLEAAGVKRTHVDVKTIYHIPHDDSLRVGNVLKEPDYLQSFYQSTKFKIRTNRFIANVMPVWNKDRIFLPFTIEKNNDGYLKVRKSGESIHYVPPHILDDAEYYAALEIISWKVGLRAFDLDRKNLRKLISSKDHEKLTPLDIEIAIFNQASNFVFHKKYMLVKITPDFIKQNVSKLKLLIEKLQHQCLLNKRGLVLVSDSKKTVIDVFPENGQAAFVPGWRNFGMQTRIESRDLFNQLLSDSNLVVELDKHTLEHFTTLMRQPLTPEILLPKDKIYIDAQHGLGNRLRAMASAAAIAKATDRELVVVWEPDHHCDCRLSDLYDYKGAVIEEAFTAEAKAKQLTVFNYMEIEDGAEKDAPIIITSGKDVYARSAYVLNSDHSHWDKENNFLRRLTPTKQVLDLISPFEVNNRIAVHVRMEAGKGLDHNTYDSIENWTQDGHDQLHFWREKSHYSHFIKKIDQLMLDDPSLKLFLATDLPETYKAFEEYYGSKLAYLNRSVYDRSKEQIIYALADAMLLSGCNRLLGSTWSSFSEIAIRLSTTYSKVEMSGKDF